MTDKNSITATLVFSRAGLLYDIKNNAYIQADVQSIPDERGRVQTMDIAEEGNVDRLNRVMDIAFDDVQNILFSYVATKVENEFTGQDDTNENDYTLKLNLPAEFSQASVNSLRNYIHEYMVARVLGDWLSIVNKDVASGWLAKADSMAESIRSTAIARVFYKRRSKYPF